jgi:hypothetical protein
MSDEEAEILRAYQQEMERCADIAQRLDAFNPELKGAFTGTPSERIIRQLLACGKVKGFEQ